MVGDVCCPMRCAQDRGLRLEAREKGVQELVMCNNRDKEKSYS